MNFFSSEFEWANWAYNIINCYLLLLRKNVQWKQHLLELKEEKFVFHK